MTNIPKSRYLHAFLSLSGLALAGLISARGRLFQPAFAGLIGSCIEANLISVKCVEWVRIQYERRLISLLSIVFSIFGSLCLATNAQAADLAHATVSGDHLKLMKLVNTPAKAGESFEALRFRIKQVSAVGSITLVLNERKLPGAMAVFERNGRAFSDRVVPALFKGYALLNRSSGESKRVAAALSVIKDKAQLRFSSSVSNSQAKASRLYTVTWKVSQGDNVSARVATTPGAAASSKGCGAEHRLAHMGEMAAQSNKQQTIAPKTLEARRVVTISTQADPAWYRTYGENSNAEIAAIINAAEAIYERQLGVRFAIVRQHVYTDSSPYNTTDPSAMLAAFAKNPENPAHLGFSPLSFDSDVDLKHLFTGVDLDGNVVGLSYVGAVCLSAKNAYGLTQNTSREINVVAFAHEIGHNFGASHDSTDAGGIMYPVLSVTDRFSSVSTAQISATLSRASCVEQALVAPNLRNAKINLTSKRVAKGRFLQVKGALLSNTQTPIAGEGVTLLVNGKGVELTTNAAGSFTYRVALGKIKSKKITLSARTTNSETALSAALKVNLRA